MLYATRPNTRVSSPAAGSDTDDYGSFDEEELELLNDLLQPHSLPATSDHPDKTCYPSLSITGQPAAQLISVEDSKGQLGDAEEISDLPHVEARADGFQMPALPMETVTDDIVFHVQYADIDKSVPADNAPLAPPPPPPPPPKGGDSPFTRFRGFRRGLSVTDLMSNTWCEQQFEYYLVRGKKKTSPEMEVGHRIHKDLEREDHETVVVKPVTPEDRWGLKLLNIIQGLKNLRETGQTRELPIFAYVNGVFVRGIIDELSYKKPIEMAHQKLKAKLATIDAETSGGGGAPKKRKARTKSKPESIQKETGVANDVLSTPSRRVAFISDYKTRARDSLPTASQFRGTELQLMLYHFILTTMATSVEVAAKVFSGDSKTEPASTARSDLPDEDMFSRIFDLGGLNPSAHLSDCFLAELASHFDESDSEMESGSPPQRLQIRFPTLSHLLESPTLAGLINLLNLSFKMSIGTLSNTLGVSYRRQQDSALFATKVVEYDNQRLEEHLVDVLQWWRGERGAVGVPIEEAWKCRSCEFADECQWRLQKIEEIKAEKERERVLKLRKTTFAAW